ncbi:MAG: hypothetical protein V2A65_05905 [Candidatus Omnitrophota bacterium]
MTKKFYLVVLLGIVFLELLAVDGKAMMLTQTTQGIYLFENKYIRLMVDANHGGRITQFSYLITGHEYVNKKELSLAIDHFWEQSWPGELMEAPYEVIDQGYDNNRAFLKLRKTVSGQWEGKAQNNLAGLILEKEISIETEDRAVQVKIRIFNPTNSSRQIQYWAQHIYTLGGNPANQIYYRPSRRGIIQAYFERRNIGDDWVRDPNAGWSAGYNQKNGNGLFFLVDFQKLDAFYNCLSAGTHEWIMEPAVIPPGSSWETIYVIIPYRQGGSPVFASEEYILGIDFLPNVDQLTMRMTAQPGVKSGTNFSWQTEIFLMPGRKTITRIDERISLVDFSLWTKEINLGKYGTDDLIVKNYISNEKKLIFETLFGGKQIQRISMGLSPGCYQLLGPETKVETQLVLNLEPRIKKTNKVLYVHGLHAPFWKISEAVNELGLVIDNAYFQALVLGQQKISQYPTGPSIDEYDAVILADIPAQAFGRDELRSLVSYVRKGGGLLVLGGPTSYGNGGYDNTILNSLIPFQITGPFDNRAVPEGERCLRNSNGILSETLDFSQNPSVFWANYPGSLKPGAEVWLWFGKTPFAIAWQVDRGRVIAITGSVLGAPGHKEILFTEWKDWTKIMQSLIKWVIQD